LGTTTPFSTVSKGLCEYIIVKKSNNTTASMVLFERVHEDRKNEGTKEQRNEGWCEQGMNERGKKKLRNENERKIKEMTWTCNSYGGGGGGGRGSR
jgi:hypothetical protein